jgi:hypothetical protein
MISLNTAILTDSPIMAPSRRLIPFDAVPELVQKIDRLLGKKVFFSEGTVIVPKDIPENHHGEGTFMLSAAESQDLLFLLEEYGFSADVEKRYDPLGYWDYIVYIVPAIPEIELVNRQDRRPSLV